MSSRYLYLDHLKADSSQSRGFSLIEMLVVMFVIGIMASAVMLSIDIGGSSNSGEVLDEKVEKLLILSSLAEDEAVLTGDPIGLVLNPPHEQDVWQYAWQRYRGGAWVDAGEPFSAESFPQNIELTLEVEGELVDFPRLIQDQDDAPRLPSIVFYPAGEVTPFLLTIFNAAEVDRPINVTSERIGKVEQLTGEELELQEDF